MKRVRKFALAVYLLAATAVVAAFATSLFGPYTTQVNAALRTTAGHIAVIVCLAIVALHVIITLVSLCMSRPQQARMRLEGNPNIQVSVSALASVAREAAQDADVMVEHVKARVSGKQHSEARITVEAIALSAQDLAGLARRVQDRVQTACDQMLGVPGAVVTVRFLPSKTVSVTKEVAGE